MKYFFIEVIKLDSCNVFNKYKLNLWFCIKIIFIGTILCI